MELREWAGNVHAGETAIHHACRKTEPTLFWRDLVLSADVIQEKDDGITVDHPLEKSVQSIVAVTKASIIRKDVKKQNRKHNLMHAHTHAHTYTQGHQYSSASEMLGGVPGIKSQKCHNETGTYPKKSLKIIRVCEETRNFKALQSRKTKQDSWWARIYKSQRLLIEWTQIVTPNSSKANLEVF